jgi:hypothetical protein
MPTATTEPDTTDQGQRPAWLLPVIGGVVLLLVALVAWLAFGGDDGDAERELSEVPDGVGAAPVEGIELLDLLEQGSALTFHAVYGAQVSDDEVTGELVLELYRDQGWVRQDSTVTAEGQSARTRAILDPDGLVISCIEQEGEWICAEAEGSQGDDLFGSLAAQLEGADVETSTEVILDLDATCYTLEDETGRSELCVSNEGIPVRITAADGTTLTLTSLSRDVDGDVFTPPAEPLEVDPNA